MKKILLIGDSIRIGYDQYVKEAMENVAEVYYPSENCRFAAYILRNLHNWTDGLPLDEIDAVHWNVGLWDTLRIYGDEPLTKPEVYADYINRIANRIKLLYPNAVSIFATSTPVIESGFIEDFEMRYNSDVEQYNSIARDVLACHDVVINDLYELLKDCPESYHSDQTHFYTADATECIGGRVIDILCDSLSIDKSGLIIPDKTKYHKAGGKGDKDMYIKRGNHYERVLGI
jgi:hypothetical protein